MIQERTIYPTRLELIIIIGLALMMLGVMVTNNRMALYQCPVIPEIIIQEASE